MVCFLEIFPLKVDIHPNVAFYEVGHRQSVLLQLQFC